MKKELCYLMMLLAMPMSTFADAAAAVTDQELVAQYNKFYSVNNFKTAAEVSADVNKRTLAAADDIKNCKEGAMTIAVPLPSAVKSVTIIINGMQKNNATAKDSCLVQMSLESIPNFPHNNPNCLIPADKLHLIPETLANYQAVANQNQTSMATQIIMAITDQLTTDDALKPLADLIHDHCMKSAQLMIKSLQ